MSTASDPTAAPLTVAPPAPPSAAAGPRAPAGVINGTVHIPEGIHDLEAFRAWARSEDFPQRGRFAWLAGTLWVDLTMEQAYTHNDAKTEVAGVLRALAKSSDRGRYFSDGMSLRN